MEDNRRSVGQMCTQCEDNNRAMNFCSVCKEFICTDCTKAHRRTKLTKEHKLNKINLNQIPADNQNTATALTRALCRNERHADKDVAFFCVDCSVNMCELCATEEHNTHVVKPLDTLFKEKHACLATLVTEIRQCDLQKLTKRLDNAIEEQKEKSANLKSFIVDQFEIYNQLIKERRNFLKKKIDQATEDVTQRLEINRDSVQIINSMVSKADTLLEETNLLTFLKSSHPVLEKLAEFQKKMPKMTAVNELRYNQACTTEDFDKIVQALGSIQEFGQNISEGGVTTQESSIKLQSMPSLSTESFRKVPLMEVLKSLSTTQVEEKSISQLSHTPSKVDSGEIQPVTNSGTFVLGNVSEANAKDIPNPASLVERNMPHGRTDLMRSSFVKDMISLRFQTWGLKGYWKIENDMVEMFSRTIEESEQCMEMLKEAVIEKSIELRKGSEFIVESDKWQIKTGDLKRKYPNQVEIEVNHNDSKVVIYATCAAVLNDTCDAIRIFLQDNRIKTITLHYDEPIVTYVMRNKKRLQKIRNCFSQFCIEITNIDKSNIILKGIGFGLGQAIRMTHGIALKYRNAKEEDRFNSDPEDGEDEDEDELRFSDDEQAKTDVIVQMNIIVDAECKVAAIKALCFPGDDKMIYVLTGDIMELPVEGLVNAADKTLKHNGGLAKALVQKGGRSIQEECTDHVQRNGNIPEGQVFCSGAGTLSCLIIIHAVGPKWKDGKDNEREKLYECVTSCLRIASRRKIASLAFPAISAGTFKFPLKVATLTIVKAVKDFLQDKPHCSIREIYLCDKAVDTVNAFANSLKDYFTDCDIVFSNVITRNETERRDVRQLLLI